MKLFLSLFLSGISIIGLSQDNDKKQKKELESQVSFSFHSNGIAPIPAFSLDKPALAAEAPSGVGCKLVHRSYRSVALPTGK